MYSLHQILQNKGLYAFTVLLQIKRKSFKISVEYLIYQIDILEKHILKVA